MKSCLLALVTCATAFGQTAAAIKPLSVGDKFEYRVIQSFAVRSFLGAGVAALGGQALDIPVEWGQDGAGLAQRYGSAFAGSFARATFEFTLESALHQDPRYFPSDDTSKKARFKSAFKQVFMCKTDSGKNAFAYSRVGSAFGAAFLINTWQPPSNSSVTDGIERGFIGLGADLAINLAEEFIPKLRQHAKQRP